MTRGVPRPLGVISTHPPTYPIRVSGVASRAIFYIQTNSTISLIILRPKKSEKLTAFLLQLQPTSLSKSKSNFSISDDIWKKLWGQSTSAKPSWQHRDIFFYKKLKIKMVFTSPSWVPKLPSQSPNSSSPVSTTWKLTSDSTQLPQATSQSMNSCSPIPIAVPQPPSHATHSPAASLEKHTPMLK